MKIGWRKYLEKGNKEESKEIWRKYLGEDDFGD